MTFWRSLKDQKSGNNISQLGCPTYPIAHIEFVGENIGLSNRNNGSVANENPGALAGATGANSTEKASSLSSKYSPIMIRFASGEVCHG